MSYFTDYLRNRRQQGLPMVPLSEGQQPMQPTLQGSEKMRQQSPLYNADKFYSTTPTAQPAVEQPKVDTSNAIGSLADLLGPTPAEREAQQARLERGRQQMTMWTGLIDGLRQLGNLYYTAQGARPQQFSDPYKMVDETYQREAKRLDDLTAYRRAYANQLYNLQRQMGQDEMVRANHRAMNEYRQAQIRNQEATQERYLRQLEERQRQFDARQQQQQAQFDARQQQQQSQFEARQRQQQSQFNIRQANKSTGKDNKKKKKGDGTSVTPRGWGGSSKGNSTKGKAYN